jgi:hypothetical protein
LLVVSEILCAVIMKGSPMIRHEWLFALDGIA